MSIIEEWTAWFLVRERERQLRRHEREREAERARRSEPSNVRPLRPAARPTVRPIRRRAA